MGRLEAGRSIIRLSYVLAVVAALAVALLAVVYERQSREVYRQNARADALATLNLLRSELQGTINANIELVQGLVGVVEFQPDLDQAHFEQLGARILRGHEGIRAVSAAPDMVVSMAYPVEGNEAVFGLDYMQRPDRREAALLARALGTTVLTGPIDLVQGGRGFVTRTPVFVDAEGGGRRFWGLISMAIEEGALYHAAGLADPDLPIDVALSRRGGLPGFGRAFYGDPDVLAQNPVTAQVELPFGAWALAGLPKGGWRDPPRNWLQYGLFALAGLLVVAPILGAARLLASRQAGLAAIRQREAELSRLSWRLEFALAASNVGVWDVDLATDEMFWDARTTALFGFEGREGPFGEADWAGALHPKDRERAMAQAHAAAEGRGKFVSEYRIVRPDGQVRYVRDVAALYKGEDGARRLVGLVWDVTEEAERQAELTVRRLAAEAATEAKSRFLAAMSHEIRTPMTGVLGVLRLMLGEPLSQKQRERAAIALASAQSLLEILNDILDFSKLEAKQIRICAEDVAVRPLVAEVMELMAPGAAERGLELSHAVADSVPEWVDTDATRLRQILTNLVSNAIKFTEAGQVAVRVTYARRARELEVAVEDTGIGIAPEYQERIFEQFVQADNPLTRRAGGTGLGLAICKQLVELMGGTIGLSSVPGMGSTFRFTIKAPPAGARGEQRPVSLPEPGALPRLRVLLAEDNATNQYLIKTYLRDSGHQVEVVTNGHEAARAAATGDFDVVLMDVQMPEIDGLAATRAIRALPGRVGQVPVIALTANAMPSDREACFAAGMSDYLAKPIDVAELRRALARAGAANDPESEPFRSAAAR